MEYHTQTCLKGVLVFQAELYLPPIVQMSWSWRKYDKKLWVTWRRLGVTYCTESLSIVKCERSGWMFKWKTVVGVKNVQGKEWGSSYDFPSTAIMKRLIIVYRPKAWTMWGSLDFQSQLPSAYVLNIQLESLLWSVRSGSAETTSQILVVCYGSTPGLKRISLQERITTLDTSGALCRFGTEGRDKELAY